MIIGGVGGVFRTGPGGSKTGYSETFFPIVVSVGTAAIDTAFRARTPIVYSARARIQDDEGDWVDLSGACSFFQVSENKDGGGSAFLTIADAATWSVEGSAHPDLLRPSAQPIQLFVTVKIRGVSYETILFNGIIESYSEAHGQRNGTISITARPSSVSLTNVPASNDSAGQTIYRVVYDELMVSGVFSAGQVPIMFFDDDAIDWTQPAYSSLAAVISTLLGASTKITNRPAGGLLLQPAGSSDSEASTFTVEDGNQASVTRSLGSANSYNTVVCWGYVGSSVLTQTVQDAADVAKRGVRQYPSMFGNWNLFLSTNVALATSWIAEMLRGKLSAQLQLNPFLGVGSVITYTSARMGITGSARVGNVTHRYQRGDAQTWISDVAVLG